MDARVRPVLERLYLWPTPEQALLLDAALGPDTEVADRFRAWRVAADLDARFDWGTFRLLPLVYDRLRALGVEDSLMLRMKGVYRMAWVETQALFAEVAPVIAALETAGVETMMLKGVPLALSVYRTPAARPMRDVDIAVRCADADRAIAVIESLGWALERPITSGDRAYLQAITLRSPAGRELDLHWRCLYEAGSDRADAWFWDRAQPFDFQGVATRRPAPDAMVVQLILHGLKANPEPPIRWIADVMAVLRHEAAFDWEALVAFAERERVTHRLGLGLDYLATHHAASIPPGVLERLTARKPSLAERIENSSVLDTERDRSWFGRRWTNLADYGRFFRQRSTIAALWGGLDYIRVGWRLKRRRELPAEAIRRTGRLLRRAFT
ncbi:MAG TPA: nucleotidyltransferase family protein [Caulobacteraceae bacterium]|jgi:hypothetical protein|nr:nucleotidyltransferase family protein [Caulobacteraceae bacterium]